jgi:hypothetical protein
VPTAESALDGALGRSRYAGGIRDLLLRHPPNDTGRADISTELRELLEVPAMRLGSDIRALDLRHDGCMVTLSAYLRLNA